MKYILYREQQLKCDIDTAWRFFCSPLNLSKITPKNMKFHVLTEFGDEKIYPGMIVDYIVTPILGIPLRWTTLITQVDDENSFTDFQQKGPYKLWIHHHEFIPNKEGVLMKDTVEYELPLGFIGYFAHKLFVKKKLTEIFDYRYKVLENIFNSNK